MKIMVSACLLGEPCRYDGKSKQNKNVLTYLADKEYMAICPECAGGLPTPRKPCEIINGTGIDVLLRKARVINSEGTNCTEAYVNGAKKIIAEALANDIDLIIFKENSPSCGVHTINDGTFTKTKIKGQGVAAALAMQNNIKIISEDDLT